MQNKTPARVLYIESSVGGVMGGSLTGLQHFLRGIDRRQYEPIVVLYEEKPLKAELVELGISVHIFRKQQRGRYHPLQKVEVYKRLRRQPATGNLLQAGRALRLFFQETLPATFSLVRLFRQERPDLIHVSNNFHANLDAIVAAWLTRIPCVCHVKGFQKFSWLDRLFARSVEVGICMTAAVRRHCEEQQISAKRMLVIYDGLDLDGFRPTQDSAATRLQLGISLEVPLVGIVGHIQGWKGQRVVVDAIREVRSILPEIRCLIVGGVHRNGAEYAEEIHRLVKEHGLEQNIIFTGFREDVPNLVAAMDVLIHSSVAPEPFGRVILEGMALGKPVIATNIGGVPEFVEDGRTGKLVSPGHPQALAEALVGLLQSSLLRDRLGKNGRLEVLRRFSLDRHVSEICEAYPVPNSRRHDREHSEPALYTETRLKRGSLRRRSEP
jgi:glycosyltransferase involved in cell wall biosynthesis